MPARPVVNDAEDENKGCRQHADEQGERPNHGVGSLLKHRGRHGENHLSKLARWSNARDKRARTEGFVRIVGPSYPGRLLEQAWELAHRITEALARHRAIADENVAARVRVEVAD